MIALELLAGLVLGYGVGTYIESMLHEYVPDAGPRVLAVWRRHPRLFRRLLDAHFSHHVIHHQTFRDHVTQFASPQHRARLEALLRQRGRHGRTILRNRFSDRLHDESVPEFCLPWMLAGVAIALFAPAAMALAAAVTLALPGLFSHYIHPYMHRPFVDAQREAPHWLAIFLRSRYMRMAYRNHFLHHRHGGTSNFNLVLGGDWLRGRLRRVSDEDLRAMQAAGVPLD